jgi:glycerol kinase
VHVAQQEFRQIYPQSGWVEHDVEEIWDSVVAVCRDVVAKSSDIAAIGITNCFALLNTGDDLVESQNRLLGTIAYQLDGKTTYALEGSIFIAGAVVQWLRDGLGIIAKAQDTYPLAEKADPSVELYLVPAFAGLGAPYWDAEARGAFYGLTRNAGPAEFARAHWKASGFRPAIYLRRCTRIGPHQAMAVPKRSCGWMAACLRPTGRCSFWPTLSVHLWIDQRCWKPQLLAWHG